MNDEDVTHVTRNHSVPPEIKLIIDLTASAAMIYYATHPDCLDDLRPKMQGYWDRFVHRVSIWVTRQDIRSLPEID